MVGSLLSLVITIVVVGLIFWLALWLVENLPLPVPFVQTGRVVVMVAGVLILILILLDFLGVLSSGLPRFTFR